MPPVTPEFWRKRPLHALSEAEWEALCDGCGRCCLNKIEDTDTGQVFTTAAACRLLDIQTCRCRDYVNRHRQVPDCLPLTPDNLADMDWLPATCAYRILAAGGELPAWHPLVSGDPDSVHRAGISVRHLAIPEDEVDDLGTCLVELTGC